VDIHELTRSLGFDRVSIVGHDIGLMVAYAYAAQFPQSTDRLVLMDAFLPGIGDWKNVWLMRDLWHFHFYGEVPLALVKGRERTYFEHFWNDFAADPRHSVSEADRQLYAAAYAQPGGMRAGFEYFRNFERDAEDFARLGATRLAMPVLVLTGEKASGQFLIDQARLVATDVKGVIVEGSGHWLIDEAPAKVIPPLAGFLDESRSAAGIEAHGHPDDRVATVISGTWHFGYGARFDDEALKALPPGSFYTEPPNEPHFARTGSTAVVLQISGFGPTGTSYVGGQHPPSATR
jgi:pimeloyl-ACP methyl ester carboxylesterase